MNGDWKGTWHFSVLAFGALAPAFFPQEGYGELCEQQEILRGHDAAAAKFKLLGQGDV